MSPSRMKKLALYLEYIAFVLRDEAKKAESGLEKRKKRQQKKSRPSEDTTHATHDDHANHDA